MQMCAVNALNSKDLSDEQLAGQLLMVSIYGSEWNERMQRKLMLTKPGGIILFGGNIRSAQQVQELIGHINKFFDDNKWVRPFIAVDQEGGHVARIKTSPRIPSPKLLGELKNSGISKRYSYANSYVLKSLGFNMNLSPVMDVSSPSARDFIGSRAFSSDKELVAKHAEAVIEGANRFGIISAGKHFPGHGGVLTDSHKALPISHETLDDLMANELKPYEKLIKKNKLPAIMVGHLAFPKIDKSGMPATFSRKIINDVLRGQLGYNGLIITDDIEMKAAKLKENLYFRTKLALDAGVDMVMLPWNTRGQVIVHGRLKNEVEKQSDRRTFYSEKVDRILTLKEKYNVIRKYDLPSVKVISEKSESYLTKLTKKLFSKLGFYSQHKDYILTNQLKDSNKAVLISSYRTLANQFKENNKLRRTVFFHSSYLEDKNFIDNITRKYKGSPIYVQVSNSRSLQLLRHVKAEQRDKVFLLISNNSYSKVLDKFKYKFKTYTHLPIVGRLIGEHLSTANPKQVVKASSL